MVFFWKGDNSEDTPNSNMKKSEKILKYVFSTLSTAMPCKVYGS